MPAVTKETDLAEALIAIPEIAAAGFAVSAREGNGVMLMRGRTRRGRWRAIDCGFVWLPETSVELGRTARDEADAVRQTLQMVLASLQLTRRAPAVAIPAEARLNGLDAARVA